MKVILYKQNLINENGDWRRVAIVTSLERLRNGDIKQFTHDKLISALGNSMIPDGLPNADPVRGFLKVELDSLITSPKKAILVALCATPVKYYRDDYAAFLGVKRHAFRKLLQRLKKNGVIEPAFTLPRKNVPVKIPLVFIEATHSVDPESLATKGGSIITPQSAPLVALKSTIEDPNNSDLSAELKAANETIARQQEQINETEATLVEMRRELEMQKEQLQLELGALKEENKALKIEASSAVNDLNNQVAAIGWAHISSQLSFAFTLGDDWVRKNEAKLLEMISIIAEKATTTSRWNQGLESACDNLEKLIKICHPTLIGQARDLRIKDVEVRYNLLTQLYLPVM